MADSPQPPDQPPARREPLLGRLLEAGARTGGRVAEATGIDQAIEDVAADAVVRALESPAAERAIAQALESAAVERSINRAIDSEMIDRVWERLLASDEVQKLVERIAEAPEIRNAIAAQGFGLIDDIGAQVGRIARHVDSIVERVARAIFRKPRREGEAKQAGLFSRALAMGIDAVIVNVIFLGPRPSPPSWSRPSSTPGTASTPRRSWSGALPGRSSRARISCSSGACPGRRPACASSTCA